MSDPTIEVVALSRVFKGAVVLDNITLRVPAGSVLGLLGRNGAGKTTLVSILSTLLTPSAGTARVAGFDVIQEGHEVRRRIGLAGQYAAIDEQLSGADNLVMIARLLGADRRRAVRRAADLLDAFNLAAVAGQPARTLSGGTRRRLDLAVSLVGDPQVLFLDEPTTGLDPESRRSLWDLLDDLVRGGTTVLLTTQYLEEADRLADIITVLDAGRVLASGETAQLKAQLGEQRITVRLHDRDEMARAVLAIREAGVGADPDPDRATMVVPVDRPGALLVTVRALDDAAIQPLDLVINEPSLEDVYLRLTTRRPTEVTR